MEAKDFHVSSIYGAKTKQGIVVIEWEPGKKEQLSILDAKKIAYMILEAAEAASTDQALVRLCERLNLPMEAWGMLMQELRKTRITNDTHFFEE